MEEPTGCHFLMELLVTRVEVGRYATHRQRLANAVVGFKFIRFPSSMTVTDKDFNADDDFKDCPGTLSKGKSCCFKVQSYCPTRAKVKIDVRRRLLDLTAQDDCLIQKIPSSAFATIRVGAISLDLGSAMAQILVKCASTGYTTPICKIFTKCYPLRNESKVPTGAITLQIRLTCFGQMEGLPPPLFSQVDACEDGKGGGDTAAPRRLFDVLPVAIEKGVMVSPNNESEEHYQTTPAPVPVPGGAKCSLLATKLPMKQSVAAQCDPVITVKKLHEGKKSDKIKNKFKRKIGNSKIFK